VQTYPKNDKKIISKNFVVPLI